MPSRFKLQLWGLKDVPPSLEALRTPTPFAQRGQAQTRLTRCRGNGAIDLGLANVTLAAWI
jgi:hypothetical protein